MLPARMLPSHGAVLFDLDGTLIDSTAVTAAAIGETLAAFGRTIDRAEVVAAMGTGLPLRRWFMEDLGLAEGEAEAAYRRYVRTIIARAGLVQPMPGAGDLLRALNSRAVPMAVVTTRLGEIAQPMLAAAGWTGYFTLIVGQDTAARPKPAPEPALFALNALGAAPERSAFVGDTVSDMRCGRDAGLAVVIGLTGVCSEEALRAAGATHVCAGLSAVQALLTGRPAA
jgi:HAD superfamily hydrolase (TIGR01509 family)